MNLLNNLFNVDDIEINRVKKKYILIFSFLLVSLILLLFLEKDNYYVNTYSIVNKKIVLLVEKDRVNDVKNSNKIIINDIEKSYSINKIDSVDNISMIYIKSNFLVDSLSSGTYKVYLGKERLFEYIVRIIKK